MKTVDDDDYENERMHWQQIAGSAFLIYRLEAESAPSNGEE